MDHLTQEILDTIAAYQKSGKKKRCPISGEEYIGVKFYDPVEREHIEIRVPDPDFVQPAADFEKEYGLRGIAQHYRLPKGITADVLEAYALLVDSRPDFTARHRHDKMTALWGLLTRQNPPLKKIEGVPQDYIALRKSILGVASAFNVDDIQYFIRDDVSRAPNPENKMCRSPAYKKLKTVFNRYTKSLPVQKQGLHLAWVASPETLSLISGQMAKKCRAPSARQAAFKN